MNIERNDRICTIEKVEGNNVFEKIIENKIAYDQ